MAQLKGGQKKLDKNKDGKISGADFKLMKRGGSVKKRMKKKIKKKKRVSKMGGGIMKKRMKRGGRAK
tara:strand:+ start:1136 stop:1336 length:201 start_codon:yes stop_codon:yes gene_type:complete